MIKRLVNPISGLLALVLAYTASTMILFYYGETTSAGSDLVYEYGFSMLLMWWVYRDRHQRRFPVPYEFEAFVFFAWPIVVPYYLVRTRGWRTMPGCIALGVSYLSPYLSALAVYEAF